MFLFVFSRLLLWGYFSCFLAIYLYLCINGATFAHFSFLLLFLGIRRNSLYIMVLLWFYENMAPLSLCCLTCSFVYASLIKLKLKKIFLRTDLSIFYLWLLLFETYLEGHLQPKDYSYKQNFLYSLLVFLCKFFIFGFSIHLEYASKCS